MAIFIDILLKLLIINSHSFLFMAFNPQNTHSTTHAGHGQNPKATQPVVPVQQHKHTAPVSSPLPQTKTTAPVQSSVREESKPIDVVQPMAPVRAPRVRLSPEAFIARIESVAWYVFLATIFLIPLIFVSSSYLSGGIAKAMLIVTGTLISLLLYVWVAFKEKKISLPPRSVVWTSIVVAVSLAVSSYSGGTFFKSFFGQRFELESASFILVLLVSVFVAYMALIRKPERLSSIYRVVILDAVIFFIFQGLRLVCGASFASLGVLNNVTDTVLGNWTDLSLLSLVLAIGAIVFLIEGSLSKRAQIYAYSTLIISSIGALIVNDVRSWMLATAVFFGIAVYYFIISSSGEVGNIVVRLSKRVSWIAVTAFVISGVCVWQSAHIGTYFAGHGITYSTSVPSWQTTLDITTNSIKTSPIFGVGPNRFSEAYLAFKPISVNQTDAWNSEFLDGFGLIPSTIATQGVVGGIAWIIFLVFFGIIGVRSLRATKTNPSYRTSIVTLGAVSTLLLGSLLISVPSYSLVFYTFVSLGIFYAYVVSVGAFVPYSFRIISSRIHTVVSIIVLVLIAVWFIVYVKKTIALGYFVSGVHELTVVGNANVADEAFRKALIYDNTDVYWQARSEATIAQVSSLFSSVNANTPASTSQAIATQITSLITQGISYSQKAIAIDAANYYNYLSEARVAERGATLKITGAYDIAVQSYSNAISLNQNPNLYLSLARLQASNNHLDEALKTVTASLNVKNDDLDTIFLLSQIEAAKGNLADAITAAKFAISLNSQSSTLYFQLGLLQYNNKDYQGAIDSLGSAVKLQPDYANAQYFLGLAYARLGQNNDAIAQFQKLSASNPNSQEVTSVLSALKAGKSPFVVAQPSATSTESSSLKRTTGSTK